MKRSLFATGTLAITVACAGPDADATGASQGEPSWTIEQHARIGSLDDPEQSLTNVTQVLFGPAGEIVVPQPQDHTVRVFDADGRFLTTIGRRGEGPGEFGSVTSAGFVGDTLWVGDNALARLTFFDLRGMLLRTMAWEIAMQPFEAGAYRIGVPTVLLPDRTGIVELGMVIRAVRGGGPSTPPPPLPYVRADSAVESMDTLALRQLGPREIEQVTVGGREFSIFWSIDGSPAFRIAADGGGIVVVDRDRAPDTTPSTFTVRRISAEGDTAFSHDYPHDPIPTPETLVASVAAELATRLDRDQAILTAGIVERELRSAGLVPATLEPVAEVATGTDGSIWLKLASASDVAPWLVLDPVGQPVGRVQLPADQRVLAADGDRIAVLELDALDVPYVVVYRVRH